MASPDPGQAGWVEMLGTALVGVLMIGAQAWRYLKEARKEEAQPRHMVLEAAEIADMAPIRAALLKLDKVLEMAADVEQVKEDSARMLAILERLDRAEEIAKGVRDGIFQEQMRQRGM